VRFSIYEHKEGLKYKSYTSFFELEHCVLHRRQQGSDGLVCVAVIQHVQCVANTASIFICWSYSLTIATELHVFLSLLSFGIE
jgi:hypothetical protein